jgi:hypothetical protein
MKELHEAVEDDFLDFLTKYPTLKEMQVPMSLIRLCFFSGYNSSLKRLENAVDEDFT